MADVGEVDGVMQRKSCGCCCPFRMSLQYWMVVLSILSIIGIAAGAGQAFGDQGQPQAEAYCASKAGEACDLLCNSCGSGSEKCDFAAIASTRRTGNTIGWLINLLSLGVYGLGFVAAMKAACGVWMTCGGGCTCAPTSQYCRHYPTSSGGVLKMLFVFMVLAGIWPLLGIIGGALSNSHPDNSKMTFATALGNQQAGTGGGGGFGGGQAAQATCSQEYVDSASRLTSTFQTVGLIVSIVIGYLLHGTVIYLAFNVRREIGQAKSTSSMGPGI